MYKNQLQELAQRSCFNLPAYACIREGPDHAPRFKASVNFNGEIFEGPSYCTTLRQAEHAAAEVALNSLSTKGPSRSIAARVLDETGVHKNLLQETAHRAGLNLPVYTTVRSGPGHLPVFTSSVELAEMKFFGAPAKTKKQAEKNAAMAAWAALKQMANFGSISKTNKECESSEEQEQVVVARVLSNLRPKDENKQGRQRDLSQPRRRINFGYREKKFVSLPQSLLQNQKTRSVINSDHSSVYSNHQNQQRSCFVSSLPHVLPPQAASKILPPSSSSSKDQINHNNKTIPIQLSRSQVQEQEVPSTLEEHHLKDKTEWCNGKSEITTETKSYSANSSSAPRPKPSYHIPLFTQMSDSIHRSKPSQIPSRVYGPVAPNVPAMAPGTVTIPRIINTGHYAHSIAPAVHIRSVIPVCAAPPMRLPSSNSPTTPPPQSKEEQEVSKEASSKFKELHL